MCCQGWLTGEAYGHTFGPNKPCGWLGGSSCLIYENRPHSPCQTFECEWKRKPSIPEWLKPSLSGMIIVGRVQDGYDYMRVIESRDPISPKIHEWAQSYSVQYNVNLLVPKQGGTCVYTQNPEFRDCISKIYNIID